MRSVLVIRGEEIYMRNKEKLEKVYFGKIVAIETESGTIAGIGETLDEAYEKARRKCPGRKFYFRKVGPYAAPTYLF